MRCLQHQLSSIINVRNAENLSQYYRVMQSDMNSFWGDVVFDSFNQVSRYKDNILDQIYKKQICSDLYCGDFDILYVIQKCIIEYSTKTQFHELYVVECCISLNNHFLSKTTFPKKTLPIWLHHTLQKIL